MQLRPIWRGVGVLGALVLGSAGALSAAAAPPASHSVIVVLRDGLPAAAIAQEHARDYGAAVEHVYQAAMQGYAAQVPAARLNALARDPRVAFISDDRPVHAMPKPDQGAAPSPSLAPPQSLPTGVQRIAGDVSSTLAGNGAGAVSVAVAVIDTGIDLKHPDLNVAGGVNCSTGRSYADGNGHGTHVAGTIGARDNATGVVGVAPGVPLYAVRVLNNAGSGSWSSVACGIDWVAANAASRGIKVANMSLGGGGADDGNCGNTNNDALHKAICGSVAQGVTYVVAAGNEGQDLANSVPAAYNETLTVTAAADFNGLPGGGAAPTCRVETDDAAASFSNFTTPGSDDAGHTIAAPGVCITSTWTGGGYNTISGTSMASPHVAGTAALCLAGPCAGMTPAQVAAKLRGDAAAQPAAYGFTGDPNNPVTGAGGQTLHYGSLVYAGGY